MLLIQNGMLYTMESDNPIQADLLIRDGKIAKIARSIQPREGMGILDASGLRIYPAFKYFLPKVLKSLGISKKFAKFTTERRTADAKSRSIYPDRG